jgi:glutamate/tyrosine decarboxylase-like PLP-dependent enzyme
MALRAHGLGAVREAVRRNNELARRMEQRLADHGFRVMEGGELSIACARFEPPDMSVAQRDALQQRIAAAAVASGRTWFGTVRAQDQLWLRFAFLSTATDEGHVDTLADELNRIARS